MTTQHPTKDAWTLTACGLVLLVIVTPSLLVGWLDDDGQPLMTAASADGLTVAPAALVAAVLLYTSWRVSAATSPAWTLAAVTLLGVKTVSLAGIQLTDPTLTATHSGWIALVDAVQMVIIIGFVQLDHRPWFRRVPVAWGVAAGLILGGLCGLAVYRLPTVHPETVLVVLAVAVTLALAAVVGYLVWCRGPVSRSVRVRLVGVVALFAVSRTTEAFDGVLRDFGPALLSVSTQLLGAALLVDAGVSILRQALADQTERSAEMERQVAEAEREQRLHRARMHEYESAVAGIVSANELLRDPSRLPPSRRGHLEEMISAELGRLERLLRGGHLEEALAATAPQDPTDPTDPATPTAPAAPAEDPEGFELDTTIRTMALAHQAKGTTVRWMPSGRRVRGHSDDVTEVLNILLDNAARHGGADAEVTVRETPSAVEILVSDTGPGIAPGVRERLFQWGARGSASPGHGIGLHLAHSLMQRQGGYLQLGDNQPVGATFVVGIPQAQDL